MNIKNIIDKFYIQLMEQEYFYVDYQYHCVWNIFVFLYEKEFFIIFNIQFTLLDSGI
jgi:hypothetical protein